MGSLLYYSISSDLIKDEIIRIDKQVANNRAGIYLFLKKLPSNSIALRQKDYLYMECLYLSLVNH